MNDEMARAAPCDLSTDSPLVRCTFDPSSANFCRMSFSRRPSCGASTVMKRPLMPRFSACLRAQRRCERKTGCREQVKGERDALHDLACDLAVLVDVELHELDLPGLGGVDDLVERA